MTGPSDSERREPIYKLTVFDKTKDNIDLTAYVNDPESDITTHNGLVVVHDVDGEWLVVPVAEFGYISVVLTDG